MPERLSAARPLAGRTVLGDLRASRRRVAGLRRDAGAARRRRLPRGAALRVARRARIDQRSGAGARRRISAASASASCSDAAAVLGIAEVILLDHPDGDLRWDHVPSCTRRSSQLIQRYRARRRDHVRRGRPLLAPRSHRRPRADLHRGAVVRRRGAAAVLRHDAARRDARGRRGRASPRAGRRPTRASGASRPTPSATAPTRRPS